MWIAIHKRIPPLCFIGLEGIQPRNDDGGEMKSHRIQKAPKGISFILHGARNACYTSALCTGTPQLDQKISGIRYLYIF